MKRLTLLLAALVGAGGAFAQNDTALVPFVVNVNATVKAVQGSGGANARTVSMQVTADEEKILRLPLSATTGVAFSGAQRRTDAPAVMKNRAGKITVNLPAESYRNAEVALYSVNGKAVLRQKASAATGANSISRRNIAPGAYLLSVRGTDGNKFTSRLTHGGGSLDLNAAFGNESENVASLAHLSKKAEDYVAWTFTVSAGRYFDSSYSFSPVTGVNELQNITLRDARITFTDVRDGKTYSAVTIGEQTWMAENLNYGTSSGSWCSEGTAKGCAKYGRLYDWATAMDEKAYFNDHVWGGSDVNYKGVCPAGWHLPSCAEWGTLAKYAGGTDDYGARGTAGKKLKSTSGWNNYYGVSGNGTDEFGFCALPGGDRSTGGRFNDVGSNGYWWSATQGSAGYACGRDMGYDYDRVDVSDYNKGLGFSVRCVRD
jgi:uncharacterized protein (TIGR02145 family)